MKRKPKKPAAAPRRVWRRSSMMRKRRWSAPRWPARWRSSASNAARPDKLNLFGEALRQALEGWGAVEWIEPHVEQTKTGGVTLRGGPRVVEFRFGGDDGVAPRP